MLLPESPLTPYAGIQRATRALGWFQLTLGFVMVLSLWLMPQLKLPAPGQVMALVTVLLVPGGALVTGSRLLAGPLTWACGFLLFGGIADASLFPMSVGTNFGALIFDLLHVGGVGVLLGLCYIGLRQYRFWKDSL